MTRVSREVGTEGVLGGQAEVKGVSGVWKDLTESVNGMANNLTTQVRNIAFVTTAVANGDLSQKITAEAKGEMQKINLSPYLFSACTFGDNCICCRHIATKNDDMVNI